MEQIRIGVIGLGWRAGVTKYWHRPDGKSVVVAGADTNPARLDKFRERVNPDADVMLDYRELL